MNQRTFDDFDGFAQNYRALHSENIKRSGADSLYFAEMKVRLLNDFAADSKLFVLDIGCGDGVTEQFMLRHFPNWKIWGIDVSAESIGEAKSKQLPGVNFQVYDGKTVPFKNENFNLVFIAGVLHHIEFSLHEQLIKEIFRVLKPGGSLSLFEHNPLNPFTKYLVKTCVFDNDARLLPYGYTERLLSQNGFLFRKKRFIIFFPRKGILAKLIFLEKYLTWLPIGGQYFLTSIKRIV